MLRVLAALLVSTIALADGSWGPVDSVHALDGVIEAVSKIVKLPHLSPAQLDEAKKVATDVKNNVEAVESGKLSKQQAHEKVGAALKELAAFEATVTKFSGTDARVEALKKQLTEKQAALAKAEKMLHLLNLQKELMEKKLMLEKLLAAKAGASDKKTDEQDVAAMAKLVTEVQRVEANWTNATAQSALVSVRARKDALAGHLAVMDATEKKSEDMMESALKNQLVGAAKGDALVKGQAMLKQLKKREHRKFAKARAQQQIALDNVKGVESMLEKHDVAGLQKSLQKVEQESKSTQAKSGKFLY